MAQLDYNENQIKTYIQPGITDCTNYLNNALGILNNLNIPFDFEQRESLQNSIGNLNNTNTSLKNTNNWITDSINKINKVDNEYITNVSSLSTNGIIIKSINII